MSELSDAVAKSPQPGGPDEQPKALEEAHQKASLQQLLLDCYEFHGLADLGLLIIFFFFASFYLFLQWGSSAATFKNVVISSMQTYGVTQLDWQSYDFRGVDNLGDAVDFSTGYMQLLSYSSSLLQVPDIMHDNGTIALYGNRTLYVGDFAQISYARLFVDLGKNCKLKSKTIAYNAFNQKRQECWLDKCPDIHNPDSCTDQDLAKFLKRWQPDGKTPDTSSPKAGRFVLTIFSSKGPWQVYNYTTDNFSTLSTVSDVDTLMTDIDGDVDRRVVYKYAASWKLGMVGSDRLSDRKDAAMFTLTTTVRGHNKRLLTFSGTSTIFLKGPGTVGVVFDVMYVIFTIWFLRKEIARARLAMLQHRTLGPYVSKGWNWWQMLSHVCNIVWLIFGWCIKSVKEELVTDNYAYRKLEGQADNYNIWLMCGIVVVLILGVTLCRFMRIHVGLNAFYHVLTDALREIADFLVFVIYIFVVLGSAIFAFFQICGGNSMFIDYGQGVLAMSRLMFGFLDFEEFHNFGYGLGTYYWTVTFLFWLAVVFLVLFTFNVLLAIFALAYENAQKRSIKVEYNFVVLVVFRLAFAVQEAWYLYIALPFRVFLVDDVPKKDELPSGPPDAAPGPPTRWTNLKARFTAYRLHMHDYNFSVLRNKKKRSGAFRINLLFARWCISRMPEMQAILAMYEDFADQKMIAADEKPSWPWLDYTTALIALRGTSQHGPEPTGDVPVGTTGLHPPLVHVNKAYMQSLRKGKKWRNFGLAYEESVPELQQVVTRKQLENLMQFIYQERYALGYQHDRRWMRIFVGGNPFEALKFSSMPHLLNAIMSVYDLKYVPQPTRDTDENRKDDDKEEPQRLYRSMTQQAEVKKVVVKRKVDDVMKMLHDLAARQAAGQASLPRSS